MKYEIEKYRSMIKAASKIYIGGYPKVAIIIACVVYIIYNLFYFPVVVNYDFGYCKKLLWARGFLNRDAYFKVDFLEPHKVQLHAIVITIIITWLIFRVYYYIMRRKYQATIMLLRSNGDIQQFNERYVQYADRIEKMSDTGDFSYYSCVFYFDLVKAFIKNSELEKANELLQKIMDNVEVTDAKSSLIKEMCKLHLENC